MKSRGGHEELCLEIAGELRDITRWLAGGDMNPEQFRLAVEVLEERKVSRYGFRLSSTIDAGGIATFALHHAGSGELCTTFRVDPCTGALEEEAAAR